MTMDKSWKDMLLGPSEKDHERWAKESAVRIAKQMDEALKKADTASTMTIEIKQVDIEFLAGIREAMGQKIIADELRAGRSDADNWPWKPLTVLATQRSAYEARIAELELERAILRQEREDYRTERNAAEARLAEAVAALRPFAGVLDDYDPADEDDGDDETRGTFVAGGVTDYSLRLGYFRRAARFIQETERG